MAEDTTGRALDIQSHLHSSFYYLISSIRADWPHGALNPGGLASDNYDTVRKRWIKDSACFPFLVCYDYHCIIIIVILVCYYDDHCIIIITLLSYR